MVIYRSNTKLGSASIFRFVVEQFGFPSRFAIGLLLAENWQFRLKLMPRFLVLYPNMDNIFRRSVYENNCRE